MKVYEVSDCDWVVANTPEEARRCAAVCMGSDDCLYDIGAVNALSPERMDSLTYYDECAESSRSFQAELDRRLRLGLVEAELFASTEW